MYIYKFQSFHFPSVHTVIKNYFRNKIFFITVQLYTRKGKGKEWMREREGRGREKREGEREEREGERRVGDGRGERRERRKERRKVVT